MSLALAVEPVEECDYCQEALLAPSGFFRINCQGCTDRSLGGSPEATAAFGLEQDTKPLRDAIVRVYPAGQRNEALERIRVWFGILRARGAS